MSDKENIESQEDGKSSRANSSSSNVSSAARSLVGHAIDDAYNTVYQEIPGENYISSSAQSMIDDVLDYAVEKLRLQSSSPTMNDKMTDHTVGTLNNEKPEMDRESFSDVPIIAPIRYVLSPEDFESSEKEAFILVDKAINSAIRRLEEEALGDSRTAPISVPQEVTDETGRGMCLSDKETPVTNVEWPRISNFNENIGEKKIDEFIMTWNLGHDWLHCVDYLGCLETRYDYRHKYRARFSIPTHRQPIPRASAAVYFTIVASKIKSSELVVDVFYVLESTQLVHKPGEYIFCELWLRRIIDQKTSLMQLVVF